MTSRVIHLDAITVEGLGFGSTSNFYPILAAALKTNKKTPEELYKGVSIFGGNSGGSWSMAQMTAYNDLTYDKDLYTGEQRQYLDNIYEPNEKLWPLDRIKLMDDKEAAEFYTTFFLQIMQDNLLNSPQPKSVNIDDIVTKFKSQWNELVQSHGGDEVKAVRDFFLLSLSSDQNITQILTTHSNTNGGLSHNIIDFIKWLIENLQEVMRYAELFVEDSYRSVLYDWVLFPFSPKMTCLKWEDVTFLNKKAQKGKEEFINRIIAIQGAGLLAATMNTDVSEFWQIANLIKGGPYVSYEWNCATRNPLDYPRQVKCDVPIKTGFGIAFNQVAMIGRDSVDLGIKAFNLEPEDMGDITYSLDSSEFKKPIPTTMKFDWKNQNPNSQGLMAGRTVLDCISISSAAAGALNARQLRHELPIEIIKNLTSKSSLGPFIDIMNSEFPGVIALNNGELTSESIVILYEKLIEPILYRILNPLFNNKSILLDQNSFVNVPNLNSGGNGSTMCQGPFVSFQAKNNNGVIARDFFKEDVMKANFPQKISMMDGAPPAGDTGVQPIILAHQRRLLNKWGIDYSDYATAGENSWFRKNVRRKLSKEKPLEICYHATEAVNNNIPLPYRVQLERYRQENNGKEPSPEEKKNMQSDLGTDSYMTMLFRFLSPIDPVARYCPPGPDIINGGNGTEKDNYPTEGLCIFGQLGGQQIPEKATVSMADVSCFPEWCWPGSASFNKVNGKNNKVTYSCFPEDFASEGYDSKYDTLHDGTVDSIENEPAGIRYMTFQNIQTHDNVYQGIMQGSRVNLSIIITYSNANLAPIPSINPQGPVFEEYRRLTRKLYAQARYLNDKKKIRNKNGDLIKNKAFGFLKTLYGTPVKPKPKPKPRKPKATKKLIHTPDLPFRSSDFSSIKLSADRLSCQKKKC